MGAERRVLAFLSASKGRLREGGSGEASASGRWVVIWVWVGLAAAAVVAVAYWLLVIAEGTYLGPRVVALTYDWVARRYDAVKRFVPRYESWFVAMPLLASLGEVKRPLVLDVATGTGRVPLALLQERFPGQIVGLDLSWGMLRQARAKLRQAPGGEQVSLIWQEANRLPFESETFDAVTCLESLEFFPDPLGALAEMVRVLRPGGVLLVTNRVGHEARLLPGRTIPRPKLEGTLAGYGLRDVLVRAWQVDYDLASARKEGTRGLEDRGGVDLGSLVRCPECGGPLEANPVRLICPACARTFVIREGIVCLAAPERRRA